MHPRRQRRVGNVAPFLRLAHLTTWKKQGRFATFAVRDLPCLPPLGHKRAPMQRAGRREGLSSTTHRPDRGATGTSQGSGVDS